MFCQHCGARLAPGAAFCATCGRPVAGAPAPATASGAPVAVAAAAYAAPQPAYAGFWLRFLAHIIDNFVLSFVAGMIFAVFLFLGAAAGSTRRGDFGPGLEFFAFVFPLILGLLALQWLYYAFLESSEWQATLGKKLLGITVTDLAGNRISFARATGRYFGKILSGIILMIGYIMAGFTERKQALHDILAGTLVLRR